VSGLQFVADLVGSLAWPAVVLVVAFLFRHQLAVLLARPFSSLKAGPMELMWDTQFAQVEADLDVSEPPPASPTERARSVSEQLVEVARIAPGAAVVQAFARIEAQLRLLLLDAGIDPGKGSAVQLARRAHDADLVQQETVKAIEGTAVLRNLAAHGHEGELDEARALDYLALTDAVSYALTQQSRRAGSVTDERARANRLE